ncbi:MAG TPA: hypothetical protein VLH16_08050, partial [Bacteroidales bacterium]|nr:hypothetical protein [Bacteroidales bacterium]
KLMAGCPGSLRGHPDVNKSEVGSFMKRLQETGLDVRYREIYGTAIFSGCGSTDPYFETEAGFVQGFSGVPKGL